MTWRQYSGTKLSIRRGKLTQRRQYHCGAGGYRYGGTVHLLAALPLCEQYTLSRAAIATDAGSVGKPANDRRDNVPRTQERAHALNHGGAIV
jgi:hypothetical protein